jgi:hypothetical protein
MHVEGVIVLLAILSAALGALSRGVISVKCRRVLMFIGIGSLVLVVAITALVFTGHASAMTAAALAIVPLGLSTILLPFAIIVRWRRS